MKEYVCDLCGETKFCPKPEEEKEEEYSSIFGNEEKGGSVCHTCWNGIVLPDLEGRPRTIELNEERMAAIK